MIDGDFDKMAEAVLQTGLIAGEERWLAHILYPEAFPEDLRPIVRDFYTRLYHQTPSEAQLDQLLRAPALPA